MHLRSFVEAGLTVDRRRKNPTYDFTNKLLSARSPHFASGSGSACRNMPCRAEKTCMSLPRVLNRDAALADVVFRVMHPLLGPAWRGWERRRRRWRCGVWLDVAHPKVARVPLWGWRVRDRHAFCPASPLVRSILVLSSATVGGAAGPSPLTMTARWCMSGLQLCSHTDPQMLSELVI